MAYEVAFDDVSTTGLESSPVATALAGLRANEARYFKNKCGDVFSVEPASKAKKTIDWVHRILKEERDLVIGSRPLEATALASSVVMGWYLETSSGDAHSTTGTSVRSGSTSCRPRSPISGSPRSPARAITSRCS